MIQDTQTKMRYEKLVNEKIGNLETPRLEVSRFECRFILSCSLNKFLGQKNLRAVNNNANAPSVYHETIEDPLLSEPFQ